MAALDYAPLALPKRYPKLLHQEGTITYPTGGNAVSNPLRIDPSGLLLGVLITGSFTLTKGTGAAPTASTEGIYGLIKRVQLSVGGGVGRLVDLTGYELNVVERTREQDYIDDGNTTTTDGGTCKFALYVPVCVRDGDLYSEYTDLLGALYTGDPQVTCNLTITWGSESNVYSTVNTSTLAGSLTVTSHKLDVPTPDKDPELFAAISWNHVVIEEINDTTLTAAGNKILTLSTNEPRVYLRLWLLYADGSFTVPTWKNGILNTLDFSIQDYLHPVEQIVEQAQLEMQLRRYANALPAGTYVVDFAASMYRNQWLPVDRITLAKLVPNFNSPGSNATVRLLQESVVPSPLARKWAQQIAAGKRAA